MKENRFWSTQAGLEVITRVDKQGDLLRLDAATPALVLAPEFTELHAQRVINGLMAWIARRERDRAGVKRNIL